MNTDPATIDIADDSDTENRSYVRSQSDPQLPSFNQGDKGHLKRSSRTISASDASFSVIYEVPTDETTCGVTFVPPPSAASSSYNHQQYRRSTVTGPSERQLSILDPMSDRVSTILVWQNLVVSTREDKRKQFFQRLTSKDPQTNSKRLLHYVSGAITGGLWAVMGKSFF
jgi:hypothetical protein